ncbi:replication initiator [Streptomyces spongiae]|uniref:replication initiator n=1 Tax=Streptomyces spongiae TaxID=565072 RepID=UPI00389A8E39
MDPFAPASVVDQTDLHRRELRSAYGEGWPTAPPVDVATGEILHHYDTRSEPGERLSVRCRNRRATVCAPCS